MQGAYPEIIRADWQTSETLEVILKEYADLRVFRTFLKDEVLNLVDFKEHLDMILRKQRDDYFEIIGVN